MANDRRLLRRLTTERQNPASLQLDGKSALQIARIINAEDAKVARVVKRALPQVAQGIEWIADGLRAGGRLIYIGTGTSGRIAALDAAECPPTFNINPKLVQFIMAGGSRALGKAVEADEDSRRVGERDISARKPGKNDVIVGIAASGRTPYTVAALAYARRRGAKTIAVTCNRNSPLEKVADLAIVAEVGPEVLAGSTRMKAATAQKMVLNMLSTGAMTRLGYVHSNLMVNLRPKNSKLAERGIAIIQRLTNVSRKKSEAVLHKAGNVSVAVIMLRAGLNRTEAQKVLAQAKGRLRTALAKAHD
jgi:N-acetylmuramic acid 6-phosphate etherase